MSVAPGLSANRYRSVQAVDFMARAFKNPGRGVF
jgi:hypothetical protein